MSFGIIMHRYDDERVPFGNLTPFLERITVLAEPMGIPVIGFDPREIQWEQDRIRGARYLGPGQGWVAEEGSIPAVLWSRYYRKDPFPTLRRAAQSGATLFNSGALNKWEAYNYLRQDAQIGPHLPETRKLTHQQVLSDLVDRFPVVYVKPVSGSVGRGIIKVARVGADLMRMSYVSRTNGSVRTVIMNGQQFARWLGRNNRSQRFLAQRGLQLGVYGGQPADLRVLVQKDGHGRWGITGMAARVAAPGRFTANLHTGGRGVPVDDFLQAVAPNDRVRQRRIKAQAEEFVLYAAERIEVVTGPLGELGFDLGVDPKGRLWYLEHNAQPGRAIFDQIGRPDLAELAHIRPVEYAQFLRGR